jgi:hypothetical protein
MISLGKRSTASYWAAGMWPRVQNLILSVWPEGDVEANPQDDRAACGSRTPPFPADLPAIGSHRNGGQATSPPPPYVRVRSLFNAIRWVCCVCSYFLASKVPKPEMAAAFSSTVGAPVGVL